MLTSWDVTFCHAALGRTISSRLLRKCVFRCCWTFKGATSPIVGLRWTCTMMTSYNAEQVRNVLRLFGDRRSGCVGNTISIYTNDPISISITGVEVHVHSTHSPCKKPVQIEILVPACPSPNQRIILVSVWPNRQNGGTQIHLNGRRLDLMFATSVLWLRRWSRSLKLKTENRIINTLSLRI